MFSSKSMMRLDAEGLLGGEHVVSWQHEPRALVVAVLQTDRSRFLDHCFLLVNSKGRDQVSFRFKSLHARFRFNIHLHLPSLC